MSVLPRPVGRCLWDYCPKSYESGADLNRHWLEEHFPSARCISSRDVDRYRRVQIGNEQDTLFSFLSTQSQPLSAPIQHSRKRSHDELETAQGDGQAHRRRSPRLNNTSGPSRLDDYQVNRDTPPPCSQPPQKRMRGETFGSLNDTSSQEELIPPLASPSFDALINKQITGHDLSQSSTSTQEIENELTHSSSLESASRPTEHSSLVLRRSCSPGTSSIPFKSCTLRLQPQQQPPAPTADGGNAPQPITSFLTGSLRMARQKLNSEELPSNLSLNAEANRPLSPVKDPLPATQSQSEEGPPLDLIDGLMTQARYSSDT